MKKKKINYSLRAKVHKYLEYTCKETSQNDQDQEKFIINKLSGTLQA